MEQKKIGWTMLQSLRQMPLRETVAVVKFRQMAVNAYVWKQPLHLFKKVFVSLSTLFLNL